MLQEVVEHSLHVLTVNAFLACTTATASLTALMAVMNNNAVSVNLPCHCNYWNFLLFSVCN